MTSNPGEKKTSSPSIVGSVLHGAYGDYYEQLVCLKHLALANPASTVELFFASESRFKELAVYDYSWAGGVRMWAELPDVPVTSFHQFQAHDLELQKDVLSNLPSAIRERPDLQTRRLPWLEMRPLLPLSPDRQIALSAEGQERLRKTILEEEIDRSIFRKPTIGVLWRYRSRASYAGPVFQPPAEVLVKRYSAVLRRLIEETGCHVLVCGMKIETTDANRQRTDNKFPSYGLDLPASHCTHLKGLSWPLEVEILSRCTAALCHLSGFSEVLWLKRPHGVVLTASSMAYRIRLLARRMPFFGLLSPRGISHAFLRRHTESYLYESLRREMFRDRLES